MPIFCAQIENNTEEIKYRTEPNQYSAAAAIQLLTGWKVPCGSTAVIVVLRYQKVS